MVFNKIYISQDLLPHVEWFQPGATADQDEIDSLLNKFESMDAVSGKRLRHLFSIAIAKARTCAHSLDSSTATASTTDAATLDPPILLRPMIMLLTQPFHLFLHGATQALHFPVTPKFTIHLL
jgi:hypothetical protein